MKTKTMFGNFLDKFFYNFSRDSETPKQRESPSRARN